MSTSIPILYKLTIFRGSFDNLKYSRCYFQVNSFLQGFLFLNFFDLRNIELFCEIFRLSLFFQAIELYLHFLAFEENQ